jgi:anti-anti-sigma factor
MTGIEAAPGGAEPDEPSAGHLPSTQVRIVRDLHSGLDVRLVEAAGHARVAVSGEIDLGCAHLLEEILRNGLRTAPGGLDVDLSGVGFFDCSGLNVLLRVRARALDTGTRLVVTRMSPPVARLLELARCEGLFT